MRYLIATRVGGIMETPHVTYENKQWIEADTPEQAVKIYNSLNNCSYYYGEVIGTCENLSKLSESDKTLYYLNYGMEEPLIQFFGNGARKAIDKERIKLFLDRHICLGTDKEISFEEQIEIQKQLYDMIDKLSDTLDNAIQTTGKILEKHGEDTESE